MNPIIDELNSIQRRITLTIPATAFDTALATHIENLTKNPEYIKRIQEKLANSLKKDSIPPEKTPASFMQDNFNAVAPSVKNTVIQDTLIKIFKEKNITPVGDTLIESSTQDISGDLHVVATFEIMPELNDISIALPLITQEPITILESDIDLVLKHLRTQHAQWSSVNRAAQDGDQVTLDFTGEIDNKPFENGKAENFEVVLGTLNMIPGFEDQLLGVTPEEKRTLNLVFPENYFAEEVAGKPVKFHVHIKKIASPILPELDNDFIQRVGIPSGKKEDLLNKIRINLTMQKQIENKQQLKTTVFEALLQNNAFEIPKLLIEQEKKRMQEHAHSHDERTDPAKTIRISLIVGALIRKYKLTPDPKRIKEIIDEVALLYRDPDKIRETYYNDSMKMAEIQMLALEDQLVEHLLKNNS